MLSFKDRANWTPAEARTQFRQNYFPFAPTGGIAAAFTQVSVHFAPSEAAKHFSEFCRLNNCPCPIVYQSKPGEVTASPIAADTDIRTDQTAYGIFENGVCVKTVPDVLDIPFDDFVVFYLGCSHSFELALSTAGLPVRHQQVNRSVPSFKTKIPCLPVGPFWANEVASMRPMPRDLVQKAVEATAVLELVHGAPIHIGHPCWIGVKDLQHPEYDDEPNIQEGDVCLFWGCGTTAQEALSNAKLALMISISPTSNCCNFITDLNNEDFNKMQIPKEGFLQPRVVFISERFVFGSLLSDKALEQIQELEKLEKCDSQVEPVQSLAKAALRLSHASSVAIVTLSAVSTRESFSVLSIIKAAMATENKEVILLVPEEKCTEWTNVINRCVDLSLLKKPVRVTKIKAHDGNSKDDVLQISCRVLSTMEGFKLEGVHPHKYTALVRCDKEGGLWVECAAELIAEIDASRLTETADCTWPGEVLAAAMYELNCCPVHSRYLRRGLGEHKPLQQGEFTVSPTELTTLMSKFEVNFNTENMEDLLKKTNTLATNSGACLGTEA